MTVTTYIKIGNALVPNYAVSDVRSLKRSSCISDVIFPNEEKKPRFSSGAEGGLASVEGKSNQTLKHDLTTSITKRLGETENNENPWFIR